MARYQSLLTEYNPPGGRLPPPELVALLRDENPDAEVIYAGKGKWILGTVKHDKELRTKVGQTIRAYLTLLTLAAPGAHTHIDPGARPLPMTPENRRELHYRLWKKKLQYQGFRIITVFDEDLLNTGIVVAYKTARWTRRNREAAMAVEREGSRAIDDPAAQQKEIQARHQAEHRSLHRYAFRGQKSVLFDVPDYDRRVGRSPAGV